MWLAAPKMWWCVWRPPPPPDIILDEPKAVRIKNESESTKVLPATITSMCTYNARPGRATLLPPTLTGRPSPSSNIRSSTHELLSFLRFFEKPWAKPLPHIFLSGQNELVFNYYFLVQRNHHGTYTYYTYRPHYLVVTFVLCFAASSLTFVGVGGQTY